MYHPPGGDAFEFVELEHTGTIPLDVSGFSFDGIGFVFPDNTVLAPGALVVLASAGNPAAFAARHPGLPVSGWFDGSLANGGERLALLDRQGRTVTAVHYDSPGWPGAADGNGASLELQDSDGDPNSPRPGRPATPRPAPRAGRRKQPRSRS